MIEIETAYKAEAQRAMVIRRLWRRHSKLVVEGRDPVEQELFFCVLAVEQRIDRILFLEAYIIVELSEKESIWEREGPRCACAHHFHCYVFAVDTNTEDSTV